MGPGVVGAVIWPVDPSFLPTYTHSEACGHTAGPVWPTAPTSPLPLSGWDDRCREKRKRGLAFHWSLPRCGPSFCLPGMRCAYSRRIERRSGKQRRCVYAGQYGPRTCYSCGPSAAGLSHVRWSVLLPPGHTQSHCNTGIYSQQMVNGPSSYSTFSILTDLFTTRASVRTKPSYSGGMRATQGATCSLRAVTTPSLTQNSRREQSGIQRLSQGLFGYVDCRDRGLSPPINR